MYEKANKSTSVFTYNTYIEVNKNRKSFQDILKYIIDLRRKKMDTNQRLGFVLGKDNSQSRS